MTRKKRSRPFDKYDFYTRAVQSPDEDAVFLKERFAELTGRPARVLREDFCAAFALSCAWVRLSPRHRAIGLDLDSEPIAYGRARFLPRLSESQRQRVDIREMNVLNPTAPRADLIAALNFSYFIFKSRAELKEYFSRCLKALAPGGALFLDCFGGPQCQGAVIDRNKRRGFSFEWDQKNFDPISHHARFEIHFKFPGGRKERGVFTYDWRLWTIPELRELLSEVGFSSSAVYWEGTDEKTGEGDGIFSRTENGEECLAWVAYVVGVKKP